MPGRPKRKKRPLTKAELIEAIDRVTDDAIGPQEVRAVLNALQAVSYQQLRKRGVFTLPGMAKFEVKRRKGAKAGIRSVFGEERYMPARPSTKRVSARALKGCQDAVES